MDADDRQRRTDERSIRRPVLVTGAHRSGTTWVGTMLSASGEFTFIWEPLSIGHRPGVMAVRPRGWYTYISEANEDDYLEAFRRTTALRYSWGAEFRAVHSPKGVLRLGKRVLRDGVSFTLGRVRGRRALLKDPFAVFSAEWFARRLGCQVVVVVRHPAGFASSIKRLRQGIDFTDLLEQPVLVRDWLQPLLPSIERVRSDPDDLVGQASVLWRAIYGAVLQMRARDPAIRLVRHQDLSLDPLRGYRDLYESLGVRFSLKAEREIRRFTAAGNPAEIEAGTRPTAPLDSRVNVFNWRERLTPDEVRRVRELTGDVAEAYFGADEW